MAARRKATEKPAYKILSIDPYLQPFAGDIDLRMQRYAAKKRHMEKNLPGQEPEAGVVLSPVRGFKSSVKRSVYKALADLSDQEVYNSLISVRKQYVTMRARSEKKWQEFMQTQITPRISEKSEPAWREKLVDPTAMINEDIKAMQEALSSLGTETPETQAPEEDFDESEQADDENEPDESEIESENGQELADQVMQELRGRFGN